MDAPVSKKRIVILGGHLERLVRYRQDVEIVSVRTTFCS